MQSIIKKWGNSAAVRIPASIMQAIRLEPDQAVDVREESGRIVIEPLRAPEYDLDELVARITPENMHAPVDTGAPAGNEVW